MPSRPSPIGPERCEHSQIRLRSYARLRLQTRGACVRITLHDNSVGFHTVNRGKTMQLGFIGTGEITSSIVTGLCSFGATSHSIRLSPRNATVARELSNRFKGISVASSNQDVLDHSETIVVAVGPAAARAVLSELRFGRDRQIISLVSGLSLLRLSRLVPPATRIASALPLSSTARQIGRASC